MAIYREENRAEIVNFKAEFDKFKSRIPPFLKQIFPMPDIDRNPGFL